MNIDQEITTVTIDWIFIELKKLYTKPWHLTEDKGEKDAWFRELRTTPRRHIAFMIEVLSIINNQKYNDNPPTAFEVRHMWENALRANNLLNETKAFKAATNKAWTASPCVYPAMVKTGVEYFITESANDLELEFRINYVASVADFINGKELPCLYPAKQQIGEDMSQQEWMDQIGNQFPEQVDQITKRNDEFQRRLKAGEKAYDICKSMAPQAWHKRIDRFSS